MFTEHAALRQQKITAWLVECNSVCNTKKEHMRLRKGSTKEGLQSVLLGLVQSL
jgi:hypothetical protein